MASKLNDILNTNPEPKTKLASVLSDPNLKMGATDIQLGQHGVGESQYDTEINPENVLNLEKIRGERQGWGAEAANAIGGGLAKIPFSVIGNVASILDFEDYFNTDNEVGNAVTAWAEEVKGDIENATKIYKSNDNTLGSREWWMNNAKGLIDSAGGFIATGWGLGKGVQLISELAKGSQVIQGIGTVANAAMLNQAESIPIAMGVYKDSYNLKLKEFAPLIKQGKLTEEEADLKAREVASDAAAYSININRINIPLNLTSAAAFLRTPAMTREVAKNFSRKEVLEDLVKEGAQEYFEENINMIAEKEAIRKAQQGKDYTYDFDKTVNDVLSKEGFETGLVGFIGGMVQTAGTKAIDLLRKDAPSYDIDGNVRTNEDGSPILVSKIQSQKERYLAQQKSLKGIELLSKTEGVPTVKETLSKIKTTSELLNDIQIAAVSNDFKKVEELQNELLINQATDAFKNGTTEQLISVYESLAKDPGSSEKFGEDYRMKASEAVKKIEELEKVYIAHSKLPQVDEVLKNRGLYSTKLDSFSSLQQDLNRAKSEQLKEIEATGFNTKELIETLASSKEIANLGKQLLKNTKDLINLNSEYEKILSPEYTKKVEETKKSEPVEEKSKIEKTFNEAEKKANKEVKEAIKTEKAVQEKTPVTNSVESRIDAIDPTHPEAENVLNRIDDELIDSDIHTESTTDAITRKRAQILEARAEKNVLNSNPKVEVAPQVTEQKQTLSTNKEVLYDDVYNSFKGSNLNNNPEYQKLLLDGTLLEDYSKLKLTVTKHPYKSATLTQEYEIKLEYVDGDKTVFMGYLPNPFAYDNVINKEYKTESLIKQQQELNRKFYNYITKGVDTSKVYTIEELVNNGIINNIETTGGTLNLLHTTDNRKTIAEAKDLYLEYDGKVVIIDTHNENSLLNIDALFEDLFDGYSDPSLKYQDRYLTVITDSEGTFRFVPAQPKVFPKEELNALFEQLKEQSFKAVSTNGQTITNKEINDDFNTTVGDRMFITIPSTSYGKDPGKLRQVEFTVGVSGGITLIMNTNDNRIKVGITHEGLMEAKSFDELITFLNEEIAKDILLNNQQKIKLTDKSFRYSVDQMSDKEAINQLETSLNTELPFKSNKAAIVFNPDIKTESKPVSDVEAKKADIERRRQEELKKYEGRRANAFVKYNPEGSNTELTQDEIDEVELIINKAAEKGWNVDRLQQTLANRGYVHSIGNSTTALRNFLQARLNGEINYKVNGNFLNEINAKYDAEIATLENKPKTNPREIKTVEPVITEKPKAFSLGSIATKSINEEIAEAIANGDFATAQRLQDEQVKLNGTNPDVFKVSDEDPKELIDLFKAKEYLYKNLPSFIEVKDLDTIIDNIRNNGKTWGAFSDGIVYLNTQAGKGTEFHEAFHAVFRTLLTDVEISKYLNKAKSERGKVSLNEIEDYRKKYSSTLSNAQIENTIYEEYMADKFMDWVLGKPSKTSSIIKNFFNKVKAWFKYITSDRDSLEALFYKIDTGYFKNASQVNNRFQGQTVYKLIPGGIDKFGNTRLLNSVDSEKVIGVVTMKFGKRLENKLAIDFGKTKTEIIKDVLKELSDNSDILNNKDLLEKQPTTELKIKLAQKLAQEKYTFSNEASVQTIITEVIKRSQILSLDSTTQDEAFDKKSEDIGNRWDLNASNIGGFGSLSKAIRQLIGMTTIEEVDEFGRNVVRTIDSSRVYNGIERLLANTPKNKMIEKLKNYSEYNSEVSAFFEKLKGLINYNEETEKFDANNIYKAFTAAFHKSKIMYVFGDINLMKKEYKIYNANQKDVSFTQVSDWYNAYVFKYTDLSVEEKAATIKEISKLNEKYLKLKADPKSQLSEKDLNSAVKTIKASLLKIGINLSEGFISYSVLQNRTLSKKQEDYLAAFNDVTPIQISGKDNDVISNILSTLKDNKNPYEKTIVDDVELEDDNYSKLRGLAESNAIFDESVGSSSFQNADGETVYDKILASHTIRKISELKDKINRNIKSYKDFKKGYPELSEYDAKNLYEVYKKNPLLTDEFSDLLFDRNFVVNIIDGLRDTGADEEGKTFKDMSLRDTLLFMYGLYDNTKSKTVKTETGNKVLKYAQYYFKVLEASNTGYTITLPKENYYSNNEFTDLAKDRLYNFFEIEFERITRGFKELKDIEKGNPNNIPVIKGYHTPDKSGKYRATEFWNFNFLSDNLKSKIKDVAENNKSLSKELKDDINAEIQKFFKSEINDHFNMLLDNKIISIGRDANGKIIENPTGIPSNAIYTNNLLPKSFSSTYLKNNEVANFYINDLINTWSVNQLIEGDVAYGRKDLVDYVKRNKGANAMQQTFGDGVSRGAIIKEPKGKVKDSSIDRADAQMWETVQWRITKLRELGKYSKDVESVFNKIVQDEPITSEDLEVLSSNDVMLISDKDVYYDGQTYFKLSSFPLTRQYTSRQVPQGTKGAHKSTINGKYYKAYPGRDWEFNMLNEMEANNIDYVMPESASKGVTKDVSDIGSLKPHTYSNKHWGRQHEVPSGKTSITDGSQKNGLIASEQLDKELKPIVEKHDNLLAQRAKNSFYKAKNILKDNLGDGKYTLKFILDKFQETLQESGADVNLLEFFSKDPNTGEPKYNLNLPITLSKFEQLYYAHFTKDVLYSKAPGYTMVLKSDANLQLPIDKDGNIITNADIDKVEAVSFRDLQFNVSDKKDGNSYSEVLLPAHFKEFGIKPGDNLSEEVLKMLGFRIPTEDKRSMMTLKVVDFLPEFYGSVIIAPKEIVYLSGADFDVDKLYIRRFDHYVENGKVKIYGRNGKDLETRWKEFLIYERANNKDLKRLIASKLRNNADYQSLLGSSFLTNDAQLERKYQLIDIKDSVFTESLKQLGLPTSAKEYLKFTDENGELNQGVVNNELLDAEIKLYSNPAMNEIITTKSSLKELEDIIEALGIEEKVGKYSIYSINGKLASKKDNDTGKANIGPAAITNMIFNYLAKNDVELTTPLEFVGTTLKKFDYKNSEGKRTVNLIATILAAMTDNAKERLAAKLNLTLDTLGPVLYLTALGAPLKTVMQLATSPAIIEFAERASISKGGIRTDAEKHSSNDKIIAELMKDLNQQIKWDEVQGYDPTITIADLTSTDPLSKFKVLSYFDKVSSDAKVFSKINKILQLNKGFDASISDNEQVNNAIEDLGLNITDDKEFEKLKLPIDLRKLVEKDGYVKTTLNIYDEVHNKIAKEFFVGKSKMVNFVTNLIRSNIKTTKQNSKEIFNAVNKNIISYLTSRAYKTTLLNSKDPSTVEKLKSLNVDNIFGEDSIVEQVGKLKTDPEFKNNPFIKNIQVERVSKRNKILFDMLSSNTRVKNHPLLVENILNGYTELYLNEKTKDVAIGLFNYLVIKDGLQFKNNSISKYIAAFMYRTVSDSMNNIVDVVKSDNVTDSKFIETFGVSKMKMVNDIMDITFRYKEHSYDYVPYLKSKPKRILKEDGDNLIFNLYEGVQFVNSKNVSWEDIDEVEKKKLENDKVLESNKKSIEKSIFTLVGGRVKFPAYIKVKDSYYKLTDVNFKGGDYSDSKNLLDIVDNSGQAIGYNAKYEKITTFGVRDLNPYMLSVDENLEADKIFQENKLKKESRKKPVKSAEESLGNLSESLQSITEEPGYQIPKSDVDGDFIFEQSKFNLKDVPDFSERSFELPKGVEGLILGNGPINLDKSIENSILGDMDKFNVKGDPFKPC